MSGRMVSLAGVIILNLFLLISKDEQLDLFKSRLDDSSKHWKISELDYVERGHWDDCEDAREAMLTKCSTAHAPCYFIPSNHTWFRNPAVSEIIIDAVKTLKIRRPKPSVALNDIRRKYRAAAEESAEDIG